MPSAPAPTPWAFPPQSSWDPDDDLVALGADLGVGTLVTAYSIGLFPMPVTLDAEDQLGWFSPVERGVLPLDGLRVSRSLRRAARDFEIRVDTAFEDVMRGCADPKRPHGWIDKKFIAAYTELHRLGWAHSVETWQVDECGRDALVGGLYGVAIGGLFAAESKFHRVTDASKVAVVALVDLMRTGGGTLFDVQWTTPHLASLGAVDVSRARYLELVAAAIVAPTITTFPDPSRSDER